MGKRVVTMLLALCLLLSAVPVAFASEPVGEEYEDFFSALLENIHGVMLVEGLVGDFLVADGQDYTFRVEDQNYTYQIYASMDGETVNAVDNGDGSFTIRNVTGSLLIGARKVPKPPQPEQVKPAPQPVKPQPAPAPAPQPVQPQPVPQTPAEEPEVIPEVPVEEAAPEEPKPITPTPEKEEKPVKPAAPVEPIPEAAEEKEPFPWWIPVLAVLGIGMIVAIILLLSRRTVVFAVDGGTETKAQKILKGRTAARPREPEKAGAVFAGWFVDEGRTKRWDFENAKVENHMILYAKWLAA